MITDEDAMDHAVHCLLLAGHMAANTVNPEMMLQCAAGWVAIYDRLEYGEEAAGRPFGFGMQKDDDDDD